MVTAAQGAYGNQGCNGRPLGPSWGSSPGWAGPWWRGGPLWIAAVVAAFMIWWPLGLGLLAFLIGSGRMGCRSRAFRGGPWGGAGAGWCGPWGAWRSLCGEGAGPSSGNRAFDEYRAETLRRLDEEQRSFAEFLERLRSAKDKSEFDAFMAERRQRGPEPPPPEGPTQV